METPAFLPYGKPSISPEDRASVMQALDSSIITRGPCVEAFEQAIAEYCGSTYAIAFSSGTAALYAACQAANVTANDRFFVPPNTFIATAGAAIAQGGTPTFVDIDLETGNLDELLVEHNLHQPMSRGRDVIMPVHFSGLPFNTPELNRRIRHPDTVIIEDAAHALGSYYPNGSRIGCCLWSDMTTFSFHPVKTITSGEGGMVTTNHQNLYERLKRLRHNGIENRPGHFQEAFPGSYEVLEISNNYHMTEFQAALGLSQLKRIERFTEKRRALVVHYRQMFHRYLPKVKLFTDQYDYMSAFHLFVVQIPFKEFGKERAMVMQQLKERGIGTQVHYIPLYHHPYFRQRIGDISAYFPQTEKYYAEALTLPLYVDLQLKDVERVVSTLKEVLTISE